MKTIELGFEGYWLDQYKEELLNSQAANEAGIFCVYACEPMAKDKIIVIRELIHVGVSDNVAKNIVAADTSEWERALQDGESLCYSFSSAMSVGESIRKKIVEQSQYPSSRAM